MLINLSNHPSSHWDTYQKEAALMLYNSIMDLNFPTIDPEASPDTLITIALEYLEKIKATFPYNSDNQSNAVHLMGESTFCYILVTLLNRENIPVIASTTRRRVFYGDDGSKNSIFEFVQFRVYPQL